MSRFLSLSVCLTACLMQVVFGQYSSCGCGNGLASGAASGYPATTYSAVREWPAATYSAPIGLSAASYGSAGNLAGPALSPAILPEAYTATGTGQVAAAGELPVVGSTLVAGRVPVSGAAIFEGNVPAAGTVSISGRCGCNDDRIYY